MKRILGAIIFCSLLCSCDHKQERIEELETENNELRERVSELENEIDNLHNIIENAQSTLEEAQFDLTNGNYRLGLLELDEAESELLY